MSLAALFLSISLSLDLPIGLLDAICYVESGHNPAAINYDDGSGDSLGLCQIKAPTARQMGYRGNRKNLMKPENNVLYAGKYLQYQIQRYNGDYARAITAYNQGSAKHGRSKYFNKVINAYLSQKVVGTGSSSRAAN